MSTYSSMRGRKIDIARLREKNAGSTAVTSGGVSMNARGDIIGAAGRIIKTREQLDQEIQAHQATTTTVTQKIGSSPVNQAPKNLSVAPQPRVKSLNDLTPKKKRRGPSTSSTTDTKETNTIGSEE